MKKQINMDEVMFYLEEMVLLGINTELEEKVYHLLLEEKKVSLNQLESIKKRMYKRYNVKF